MDIGGTVASAATKAGSWILLPTLWITVFFLVCMVGYDVYHCIGVGNISPLVEGTGFSILGADHKLGYLVDDFKFDHKYYPISDSFKGFFDWLFERVSFWFSVINYLWFIYIFGFLLYYLISWIGGVAMPDLNKWIFLIIIFGVLQFGVGMAMYGYLNHDKVCTGSASDCMMLQVNHSIPFEGVFSLVKHFVNRDLFNNVHNLQVSGNPLISMISGVPSGVGGVS